MRKLAITAASLATAGLLAAGPAAADIELGMCFHITDQLYIEHDSDMCEAYVSATIGEQGPYMIKLGTSGNLICTALEGKYLADYSPIYGLVSFDPICDKSTGCKQSFKLLKIAPDGKYCDPNGEG
jgi:hypothetical protein